MKKKKEKKDTAFPDPLVLNMFSQPIKDKKGTPLTGCAIFCVCKPD